MTVRADNTAGSGCPECERLREALRQIAALDREIDTAKQIARAALAGPELPPAVDHDDESDWWLAGREQTGQET